MKIGKKWFPTRLTNEEEKVIVKWIKHCCLAHMHTTVSIIVGQANKILRLRSIFGFGHPYKKGPIEKDWYCNGFVERHSESLGIRRLPALELNRVNGCNSQRCF